MEKVRLLPRVFREPAYQEKGASLVNSREFGLGLRLYCHSDKPLADWERTLLLHTGEWDELRSRLGDLSGIRGGGPGRIPVSGCGYRLPYRGSAWNAATLEA